MARIVGGVLFNQRIKLFFLCCGINDASGFMVVSKHERAFKDGTEDAHDLGASCVCDCVCVWRERERVDKVGRAVQHEEFCGAVKRTVPSKIHRNQRKKINVVERDRESWYTRLASPNTARISHVILYVHTAHGNAVSRVSRRGRSASPHDPRFLLSLNRATLTLVHPGARLPWKWRLTGLRRPTVSSLLGSVPVVVYPSIMPSRVLPSHVAVPVYYLRS